MLEGYLVPHPPLIIKGIGNGKEIPKTRAAYEKIANEISKKNYETAIIISPHSQIYTNCFYISPGKSANGNLEKFGASQIKFSVEYDEELANLIGKMANENGMLVGGKHDDESDLDHGTMVALYFLKFKKIVRISLSEMSFIDHYKFGTYIKQAIETLKRKTVIIASGDMSHKLKIDGPYGLSKEGEIYDKFIRDCLENSNIEKLMTISPKLAQKAAECGLRSIIILIGIMDGFVIKSEVFNYECPYGVGYLTAKFVANEKIKSLLPNIITNEQNKIKDTNENEDIFVKLAKENVENFIKNGKSINLLEKKIPDEMFQNRSGVFVSIKKNGQLRGCIGTISPTCKNIAEEILQNSISAAIYDPRFDAITSDELESLTFSVDVLFSPELVNDKSELDVSKYGVIVSCDNRRGLLLPNIEGVNEVEEQISIALQKASILPNEPYTIERFEVVRHK